MKFKKKLLESKAKKLDTMKKLEEAKANAAAALVTAKKRSWNLSSKYQKRNSRWVRFTSKTFRATERLWN